VISANVKGIRAAARGGGLAWLKAQEAAAVVVYDLG
jgi:hypothetical protein